MRSKSRRPSPLTLVALAVLFFMLGGAAVAGKHYVITSAKQIKPSVLKQLKGAKGPKGAQGPIGPQGTGDACNAGQEQANPGVAATLTMYTTSGTWTDIASCSITLAGSHKVLIVGQVTVESESNMGDAFARVEVDGNPVDGAYWTNVSAKTPGASAGRATIPVSRVITLAAGAHTVTLQGTYWDGGATTTVTAENDSISAVDLG